MLKNVAFATLLCLAPSLAMPEPNFPHKREGYVVFQRILNRLDSLKKDYLHLKGFDKNEYEGGTEILYESDDQRLVDNPNYETEKNKFDSALKERPRSSSWVMRHRPHAKIIQYGQRGLSFYFRNKAVILEINGPDTKEFQHLSTEIRTLIREEIQQFNERSIK
jgi:hypothetical protein